MPPPAPVCGTLVRYWWTASRAGAVICGAMSHGGARLHHKANQPEPLDEIVSELI